MKHILLQIHFGIQHYYEKVYVLNKVCSYGFIRQAIYFHQNIYIFLMIVE